jgi:hypothetical protein
MFGGNMLHLFVVFVAGSGREEYEPEGGPDYASVIWAWWAFLAAGLTGIVVDFFDVWFVQIGVLVAPIIVIVFLNHLKNAR